MLSERFSQGFERLEEHRLRSRVKSFPRDPQALVYLIAHLSVEDPYPGQIEELDGLALTLLSLGYGALTPSQFCYGVNALAYIDEQEALFRILMKKDPECEAYRRELAECLYKRGREEEGLECLREGAAFIPDSHEMYFHLANFLEKYASDFPRRSPGRNQMSREAADAFVRSGVLHYEPREASYRFERAAQIYAALGRAQDARDCLEKAIECIPRLSGREGAYERQRLEKIALNPVQYMRDQEVSSRMALG